MVFYKQGDGVRYNARDLAVVRGKMSGCPVWVLPHLVWSLGAMHICKFGLLRITERATQTQYQRSNSLTWESLLANY